jgi:type I restriction enzyme S subunit
LATLDGCNYLDPAMVKKRWNHFQIQPGDYLLSSSASTGKVVLATEAVAGAIPYTGIIRLWPAVKSTNMAFVCFYIGCAPFQDQIDAAKSGVGIEHFGPTHLKRMVIGAPPSAEQDRIVEYVETVTEAFKPTIRGIVEEINLLREYRTRLIADVVTGQLDVRAAAAALPDETPEADDLDPEAPDDDEAEAPDEEVDA